MIALTQSLKESNLQDIHGTHGLKPLGVATREIYYFINDVGDKPPKMVQINEAFAAECPEADYALNVTLELIVAGHPGNNRYHCRVTGDVYKVV